MRELAMKWKVLVLVLVAIPGWASAGSVYLNGVNIDGVTDQQFEKATVRIDSHGNILIDAPGYAAKVVGSAPLPAPAPVSPVAPATASVVSPAPVVPATAPVATAPVAPASVAPAPVAPAPARITKRYWLVTAQTAPGMAEYDINVYLNARWLMTLRNTSEQDVVEVTRLLSPGPNTITLEAKKLSIGPRKSFSAEHVFTVVLGEGNEGGDNVMIDNPLVTFKRTAADTESLSKEFAFNAR